jgi:hypothetical protein
MYKVPLQPKKWTSHSSSTKPYFSDANSSQLVDFREYRGRAIRPHFSYLNYSHYYDWLIQAEPLVAKLLLTYSQTLLLTSKHLVVQQPHRKMLFSLKSIQSVSLHYRKLLFPLIIGGILAPLCAVALWNNLMHFWLGITFVIVGLSLMYYGWLGTYQLDIQFETYKISYFADQKTPELETMLKEANVLIKKRKLELLVE